MTQMFDYATANLRKKQTKQKQKILSSYDQCARFERNKCLAKTSQGSEEDTLFSCGKEKKKVPNICAGMKRANNKVA